MPCVILAGGTSRRFGSPKGLAMIGGAPLMQIVLNRLAAQTTGPIAINAREGDTYKGFGCEIVEDAVPGGIGPLAGIHAAMSWAARQGFHSVLTTPVDTPYLPDDAITCLSEKGGPAIASSRGREHPVCGFWPVRLLPALEAAIGSGVRAANQWSEICGASVIDFNATGSIDPFFNINTKSDLKTVLEHKRF